MVQLIGVTKPQSWKTWFCCVADSLSASRTFFNRDETTVLGFGNERPDELHRADVVDVARGQGAGKLPQASARETTRQHSAMLSLRLLCLGNQ